MIGDGRRSRRKRLRSQIIRPLAADPEVGRV
ncbi:hypothetical protein SSCG_02562 [Streptomyces clavuligerus]|nr:hypothetical protein SSCG_02562 [Streptomyces clavuligerus]